MLNILRLLIAVLFASTLNLVFAVEPFPQKPVRIISPFPPGGGTDLVCRVVAKKLGEIWNQSVTVENRSGAQGNIGTSMGARALPDGHTITLIIHSVMTINPHLYKNIGFDPLTDLVPVANVVDTSYLMVSRFGLNARSVKEVVALSKTKPEGLTYATTASGHQVAAELLKSATGANLLQIPFKGTAEATNALLSGELDLLITAPGNLPQFVKSGKINAIAVIGRSRLDTLAEVSTVAEQGYRELAEVSEWYGFAAPAGTPPSLVEVLNKAIVAAMQDPVVQKTFRDMNFTPAPSSGPVLAQRIRADLERWRVVIQRSNIKVD